MRIGSLFSGVGGLDLGLERAGLGRVAWVCESDPAAQAVLRARFPHARLYGDVRGLRACDVEPVEVLAGGFPCQDLSKAGQRKGLAGPRSGLWWEFDRLIGELGPRLVVMENVPAILDGAIGPVLGALAARGYDAVWDCVPAGALGALHERDRWFCLAYPRRFGSEAPLAARDVHPAQAEWSPDPHRHARAGVGRHAVGVDPGSLRAWPTEPPVLRAVDGLPGGLDRIRLCGNAVHPAVAEYVGRCAVKLLQRQTAFANPGGAT